MTLTELGNISLAGSFLLYEVLEAFDDAEERATKMAEAGK